MHLFRAIRKGAKNNADHIIQLAEAEGMMAHALAVKVRK
ncbi:MAG: histidinol dehydrogenase [Acetatifactor sp.]|nr:histidinol dehydrogenase [Acetatifactor sp.]